MNTIIHMTTLYDVIPPLPNLVAAFQSDTNRDNKCHVMGGNTKVKQQRQSIYQCGTRIGKVKFCPNIELIAGQVTS